MIKRPIYVVDTVVTYQQKTAEICKVIYVGKKGPNTINVRPLHIQHSSFERQADQCIVVNEQINYNNQNYPEYAL